MKKLLLTTLAIVAMFINSNAQTITVPAELNGWYAGYYTATNTDAETLKNGVLQWLSIDELDGNSWESWQQDFLESTTNWGDPEDPYSYYGQIKDSKFFVAGDMASKNYYAFLFVNGTRLSAGTDWRIYIPEERGAYTLTYDNFFLYGTFGKGCTLVNHDHSGINSVVADKVEKVVKMIENGQLFIMKDGVKYNLNGQIVK